MNNTITKLFSNTTSNVALHITRLAITFIMTPLFLEYLGEHDYGIWEIVGAIIGYAGLLHFGFPTAISKHVAAYSAQGNPTALQTLFSSALIFMGSIGFILCLCVLAWANFAPETIASLPSDTAEYQIFLYIIAFQIFISFIGQVPESFLEGQQRYVLKNRITLFFVIGGFLVIYNSINATNALILLAGVNACGVTIKYFIYFLTLRRQKFGALKFQANFFSIPETKKQLMFGGKVFISGLSGRVERATDSLTIGYILGASAVPAYAIPMNLSMHLRTLMLQLTHALMPLFSQLNEQEQHDDSKKIYLLTSKFVVAIVVPMGAGLVLVSEAFFTLWIGSKYIDTINILMPILVTFIVIPQLNPLSRSFLTATNQHGILARITPISALANLVLSIILVMQYGVIGAALGSLIPCLLLEAVIFYIILKEQSLTFIRYAQKVILPCILPVSIMVLIFSLYQNTSPLNTYSKLTVAITVAAAVYAILFYAMGLTNKERSVLNNAVKSKILTFSS